MAKLLKGAPAASALSEELAERCRKLKENDIEPCLALLRIGERPDDIAYENSAMKRCEKIGIKTVRFLLSAEASAEEILETVGKINDDESIHGCLMFRPLPDREAEAQVCRLLDAEKDVDCMTSQSLAGVFSCSDQGYPPCTAEAVIELLDYYHIPLEGRRVAVIGRSMVIGKPVSMMLQRRNATVTMCHTRTVDLPGVCRGAEILVAAAGRLHLVGPDFLSPGQTVIDVGINADEEGNISGDVDFEKAQDIVEAVSPVPGGVGSLTTAILCRHVIEAAEKRLAQQ